LAAAGCDGGDVENIVDSFMVGGEDGADASHYELYCQTVYHPLAHRYDLHDVFFTPHTIDYIKAKEQRKQIEIIYRS
jgi:hypothetical protein